MFVLCTGRAVRGGQDCCLVTVHTDGSSRVSLISVLPIYSKISADSEVERCRLHTHTHTDRQTELTAVLQQSASFRRGYNRHRSTATTSVCAKPFLAFPYTISPHYNSDGTSNIQ